LSRFRCDTQVEQSCDHGQEDKLHQGNFQRQLVKLEWTKLLDLLQMGKRQGGRRGADDNEAEQGVLSEVAPEARFAGSGCGRNIVGDGMGSLELAG
jgi:hypothetical protein